MKTEPGESAVAKVTEARIYGYPVEALCGERFVPQQDPKKLPAVRDLQGDLRPLPPDGRRRAQRDPRRLSRTVPVADRSAALAAVSEALLGIAGDLRSDAVLERLVDAARDLGGARYAALGVPDEEGDGFSRWISAGLTDEEIDAIGPLPRNHGLLGAALHDPEPFRSDDVPQRRPLRRVVAGRPPRPRRVPRRADRVPRRRGRRVLPRQQGRRVHRRRPAPRARPRRPRRRAHRAQPPVRGPPRAVGARGAQPPGPRAARRPHPVAVRPPPAARGRRHRRRDAACSRRSSPSCAR